MSNKLQLVVRSGKLNAEQSKFVGQFITAVVPRPISPVLCQPSFDRIVEDVSDRSIELSGANDMIKTLVLPKTSAARENQIALSPSSTFQRMHYSREARVIAGKDWVAIISL